MFRVFNFVNLALRLPKKQIIADWSIKSWVNFIAFVLVHNRPLACSVGFGTLSSPMYLWETNLGVSQMTVGRPLQQSRNSPLHYQDYLPLKTRRTQTLIQKARIRLGIIIGQDTRQNIIMEFIWWLCDSSPGGFPSSFPFISLSLVVSFSRGFFRSALLN